MLETAHRDGPGRILDWKPSEGAVVQTPTLIVPETQAFGRLDAQVVVTSAPTGQDIEIVSTGTWFHPGTGEGLVLDAPEPAPTTEVQLLHVGEDLAVWHDAGGWANNPRNAVPALIEARTQATWGKALWAPALGTPADYAVWAHAGVDVFDASPLLLAAQRGIALSIDGPMDREAFRRIHGGPDDATALAAFNVGQARRELARIQQAILDGRLRDLAERRAAASPDAVALLRRLDREHAYLEAATPMHDERDVPCMTVDSLWMPAVERFRRRVRDYTPPASADILVLLPCSATKPYRISPSHRYFGRALDDSGVRHRVHEVMVTSPLGIVPRELESTYPANKYDVPVTGHWSRDEEALIRSQLAALLDAHEYTHVVAHVPNGTWSILRDLLPEQAIHTGLGHSVQSKPDCDRLRDTLMTLKETGPAATRQAYQARKLEDVQAIASYQFGADVAKDLVAGGNAHGRVPYVKLDGPDGQIGMTTQDRGLLSLSLLGAHIVAKHGVKTVQIQDFEIRKTGSLFAVGVEGTSGDVRIGDEVVVCHGDEVRACGVARMSGDEMTSMKRGVAVSLRHVVKRQEVVA